jgi:Cdc6-like AAA superfamily ATPase
MSKTMDAWFFMRPGFTTFNLEPKTHSQYLFGERDRRQRDLLLGTLEEAGYSRDGHKAAIFGDYGRGKTHQCFNIMFEIRRREMNIVPVYIKCSAYKSKEPFSSLFSEMVSGHSSETLNRIATEYQRRVNAKQVPELQDVVQSEDIAMVMKTGLTMVNPPQVRNCVRWLGGEPKVQMSGISDDIKPQLADSRDFGAVMRGLAEMFATVDGKVPLYLIDEAERFQNMTNPDTYFTWLASMRELTEIHNVGMLFLIGAKSRNDLPNIFVTDEIVRRIGVSNYIEFTNPSHDELEAFILELLQTFIKKGEVPVPHQGVVEPGALDATVPEELTQITGGDANRLKLFPFDPDAFEEFVEQVTRGELASKPSEVLSRLQKAAQRAMRYDRRTISSKIVNEISSEGF